jgi:glycerophosphoryl diester phosphodiesterase
LHLPVDIIATATIGEGGSVAKTNRHAARLRSHRLAGLVLIAVVDACSSTSSATVPVSTQPTTASTHAPSANPFRTGHTLVIPHGGGDGLFPENTILAYERSMELGGEVIDADVEMTADGVLVAFHDPTLDRTTDGHGDLIDTTYAEVAKLDAGYGFTKDGKFPFRGIGVRVPTLEEVLRRFPTTLTTLDVKDLRTEMAAPICELLRSLNRTVDVYVGSDTTEQVMAFRDHCPELRTSGTDDERKAMRAARDAGDTSFVTHQLVGQPPYRGDDGKLRVTPETLAFSHKMGIAVLTWVVNDPKDMADLIDMGVDGIYTSRPDLMVELVKSRG